MAFQEQWEIDLRKQLEGKFVPKAAVESWEEELQEDIEVVPVKKKSNTIFFLILLIFLGLSVIFAYDQKTGGTIENWVRHSIDDSFISNAPVCEPPSEEKIKPIVSKDYESEILKIKNSIAKLEESQKNVDEIAKRVTLMGVVLNENFMIMRNDYDKSHLIFFNRDWTIDRMPVYIKFSDEDAEFLKKYVKDQ